MTPEEKFNLIKAQERINRQKFSENERIRIDAAITREGDKRDHFMWATLSIVAGSVAPFVFGLLDEKDTYLVALSSLFYGWVFVIFSWILMLVNYFLALKDSNLRHRELNKFDDGLDNSYEEPNVKKQKNWAQKSVEPINFLSVVTLICAILFLTFFFYQNIVNINNMKTPSNNEKALSDNQPQYVAPATSTSDSNQSKPEKPQAGDVKPEVNK